MCLFQRVERESTKSPATTGGRKKSAVKSNGQIAQSEPPPQPTGKKDIQMKSSISVKLIILCNKKTVGSRPRRKYETQGQKYYVTFSLRRDA